MKIYCFYLYDPEMKKSDFHQLQKGGAQLTDIYPLYAITDKKKLADEFEQDRDPKQFVRVTEYIDDEDGIKFLNLHRMKVLEEYHYEFLPRRKWNGPDSKKVKIVSTYAEYERVDQVTTDTLLDPQFTMRYSNPFILKKKYTDALRKLQYVVCFQLYIGAGESFDIFNEIPKNEPRPDAPDLKFEELAVFVHIFGSYFK